MAFGPALEGRHHLRMTRQAQIIIGAEGDGRAALQGQMRPRGFGDQPPPAVEMRRLAAPELASQIAHQVQRLAPKDFGSRSGEGGSGSL
jgi:hypothetical protein